MSAPNDEMLPQEIQGSEIPQTAALLEKEACDGASSQASPGVYPSQAYADCSAKDQRAKLIHSIKTSYPILDQCMCEAAVDMFLLYPHLAPDEILQDVSPTYFLDNIPVVTVPEQPEINSEQVAAGVAPQPDADSKGHTRDSQAESTASAGEQETTASDLTRASGQTLQSGDIWPM